MSESKLGQVGRLFGTGFSALKSVAAGASPVTCAVAVTSFLAAGLFVAFDTATTLSAGSAQIEQVARAMTADLGGTTIALAATDNVESPGLRASSTRILRETTTAADFGGVAQRGLFAFAAALLATGVAYRRRAPKSSAAAEALLESLPFGAAIWSSDGELSACNAAYRRHVEPGGVEVVPALPYAEVVRALVRGGAMRLVEESETARRLELARDDGTLLVIEDRPLAGGGFISLVTDTTASSAAGSQLATAREEQRQLARRYHEEKIRAEAASRSKTAFLAHLSHDIRTPLNHIMGFAELIRQETYGPLGNARYIDYAETIKGSGEQLLSFFGAILDLAELESGRRALKQDVILADDLIDGLARRFRLQASRAGIMLAVGAPCGATIVGDRFCLERMLANLIENALRFTAAGGRISLGAYAASDGVVIDVTDTGIGMSEERVSALSQPFAFGDASFAREHSGAGLGIPIARAIAEQSGGHLAIDSRLGVGTTVAISLPLAPALAQAEAAE